MKNGALAGLPARFQLFITRIGKPYIKLRRNMTIQEYAIIAECVTCSCTYT